MKTLTLAALAAICLAGTVKAETQLRMEVANPGATAFVIGTHLASVLNERHGYQIEVATGFPGVRSIVNTASEAADISLYAPALAYYLNNKRDVCRCRKCRRAGSQSAGSVHL